MERVKRQKQSQPGIATLLTVARNDRGNNSFITDFLY